MLKIFTPFIFVFTSLFVFSSSASTSTQKSAFNSPFTASEFDVKKLEKLLSHYEEWEGVRYKFGGNSRKGIDCSAYMQRVFADEFSLKLPRSSHEQSKLGSHVAKDELNTGDLVFFKTSARERHVGVYVGDGKFLHASTKVGVTVSELDNQYWKTKFVQARRIHHTEA
ncbi:MULTISPECIES: NlpC/P60 family protein [unclassified Serratia (in: enterobacteria)]|uniref:NlpC/P60 family protein n=1 Tax=unclassified Serratia (in: enterobacteria) TaxID=2647522 RepID=UPI000500034D|nr:MULTISPECIES: NlpC/P60 family protein [unclassified Serratia (in: enterobacteria)]KFK92865.1 hydrolase [Serratia sp. Ag2]KFK94157.1 hydrolase [Serratia sp. Ag1]